MIKTLINDVHLNEQLHQIEAMIQKKIKTGNRQLDGTLDYLTASGGKMLRPTLLLAGSRMNKVEKEKEKELLKLAVAIETIHMATLVHDDIIDQSDYRRGQLSIQAKYGQSYAVYMGDYLLSQCFMLLSDLDVDRSVVLGLAKTVNRICVGDMKQYSLRFHVDMTPYQYIHLVSGKTAALISIALSSGAYMAKATDKQVKLLARIGYEIGMAFQLVDDLLDYEGDQEDVGKDLRMDIVRGYYSMPLIYTLNDAKIDRKYLKSLLSREMSEEELSEVYSMIQKSDGIERTRKLAKRYLEKATKKIKSLPKGDTKNILEELVPKLLYRIQ